MEKSSSCQQSSSIAKAILYTSYGCNRWPRPRSPFQIAIQKNPLWTHEPRPFAESFIRQFST
jgi:hypothetical protein